VRKPEALEAVITTRATSRLWLPALVSLATLASSSKPPSSTADIESLDLNLILQRLEEAQHQDPAQSRPYEVIREYKVFRAEENQKLLASILRRMET